MKIRLQTKVKGYYTDVMSRFDKDLFKALEPDLGKMEIVEFTGSKKGDRVHLRFLQPFKAEWISDIVEDGRDDNSAYFIDEGVKLPFGIQNWRHIHIVEKIDERSSWIIDDIEYTGRNQLHTLLLYPMLFLAFYPRKQKYRSYFGGAY